MNSRTRETVMLWAIVSVIILLLLIGFYFLVVVPSSRSFSFTVNATVENTYQGDNAPFENITFSVPNHGYGFITVDCNNYRNGSAIELYYNGLNGRIQSQPANSDVGSELVPGCNILAYGMTKP